MGIMMVNNGLMMVNNGLIMVGYCLIYGKLLWIMEVSQNGGTPTWMVCKRKSHLEMDDWGVPLF